MNEGLTDVDDPAIARHVKALDATALSLVKRALEESGATVEVPDEGSSAWPGARGENPRIGLKIPTPAMIDVLPIVVVIADVLPSTAAADELPAAALTGMNTDGGSIAADRGLVQMGSEP